MRITCPTCRQTATLKYRPKYKDYVLLTHSATPTLKCASTGTVYPKELAKVVFRK